MDEVWGEALHLVWINDWVHDYFDRIALTLGPKGVFVVPPLRQNDWASQPERAKMSFCLFGEDPKLEDEFLHAFRPFLIISRSPLQQGLKSSQSVVINLGNISDDKQLIILFGKLIAAIQKDDWPGIISIVSGIRPKQSGAGREAFEAANQIFKLEPNLFGVGVNLNRAIELAWKKLSRFGHRV